MLENHNTYWLKASELPVLVPDYLRALASFNDWEHQILSTLAENLTYKPHPDFGYWRKIIHQQASAREIIWLPEQTDLLGNYWLLKMYIGCSKSLFSLFLHELVVLGEIFIWGFSDEVLINTKHDRWIYFIRLILSGLSFVFVHYLLNLSDSLPYSIGIWFQVIKITALRVGKLLSYMGRSFTFQPL